MDKDLENIRAQFLLADDVDAEDREENERQLREWETGLVHNAAYLEWQASDITQEISKKMKSEYKEIGLTLATDRHLMEERRRALWATQDACLFILSLTDKDAKGVIEQIQGEIKRALSAT